MIVVMFATTRAGDAVVEVAATTIVVGITTGIRTVIETAATEAIMIIGVLMTESGGAEACFMARNQ